MFKLIKKIIYRHTPAIITVEEEEHITDEIERSLWDIKEAYDLETEEVATVVKNYKSRHAPNITEEEG